MGGESYICPTCGGDVPVGGRGCDRCAPKKKRVRARAKRERKSWEQDESADGLDLPGEDFDYDEFVEREFGKTPHKQIGIAWYWWVTAVGLLVVFLWATLGR
ncbi:MAG: hypothetical protein AAGC74_05370 [Verrucomicrobiota bacterium]